MGLRPKPSGAQLPPVNDVAHEIDRVGFMPAQEVQESIGLATAGAKVHVAILGFESLPHRHKPNNMSQLPAIVSKTKIPA
jgi:hypothetical protein